MRSVRLRLSDFGCLSVVVLLCIGLSGLRVGFTDLLESTPSFLLGRRPLTLVLPPNTKIPPELLLGVKRRRHNLQLTLENLLALEPETLSDKARFEYPATLDNLTSVDETLDNRTSADEENVDTPKQTFYYPKRMDPRDRHEGNYKDYGNVDVRFLEKSGVARRIYLNAMTCTEGQRAGKEKQR